MMTTKDRGARSWNRFSWQRYLMNDFSSNNLGKVIKNELREMFEKPSELESDDNT